MGNIIDRSNPDFWEIWKDKYFKVTFPKNWDNMEPLMPIIKFQAQVPEDFDYYATVNVVVDVRNDNLSTDDYINSLEGNLMRMISGFDNFSIKENIDEHLTYHEISYTSEQEGFLLQHTQYFWLVCGKSITLSFACEKEGLSDFLEMREFMFHFFEIL